MLVPFPILNTAFRNKASLERDQPGVGPLHPLGGFPELANWEGIVDVDHALEPTDDATEDVCTGVVASSRLTARQLVQEFLQLSLCLYLLRIKLDAGLLEFVDRFAKCVER